MIVARRSFTPRQFLYLLGMTLGFLGFTWNTHASTVFPSPFLEISTNPPKPVILAAKKPTSRKPSRTPSSKATPITVTKVRLGVHDTYTRVVFDLQRPVTFSQTKQSKSYKAIIDLEQALLGTSAKTALKAKDFPAAVQISELKPTRIRIVVDLKQARTYKLLPLNNPPRLVLDVFAFPPGHVNASPPLPSARVKKATPKETLPTPPPVTSSIQTIMIDPGHGGKDPGAIGRNGAREKDITLKISLMLRDLLQKELKKTVLMTRDRDRFVELEERANIANNKDADLFVSVHVNSHPKRRVKGIEIYHFGEASDRRALEVAARENGTPIESTGVGWEYLVADLLTTKKVEDSLELAWTTKQAMVRHLKRRYKIRDHGVKTAPFYVLRFTSMPSILAEIGFISNPTEESLLRTNTYQRRIAQAIFRGVKAYIASLETIKR